MMTCDDCGWPLPCDCEAESQDVRRLEWLMRNISGTEARRLGMVYSAGLTRKEIDQAMDKVDSGVDSVRKEEVKK